MADAEMLEVMDDHDGIAKRVSSAVEAYPFLSASDAVNCLPCPRSFQLRVNGAESLD